MANLLRISVFRKMNALDHGVGLVELPPARHAGVDHGAIVARADDHRVSNRQLGLEP
jgi:hypothetical protein